MAAVSCAVVRAGGGALMLWAERSGHHRITDQRKAGLRFAFYGRVPAEDYQDLVTSRARQRDQAAALVAGFELIVAEFFDAGHSRVLAWARRPQAAALLAALADPGRGFGAIVIGEYERAFYGPQYSLMAPLLEHYGVQLWMPEAGGRVNFCGEGDEQLMLALGVRSKREITRTRIPVRTAMAAQARYQGRYLGGRPPCAHRLADAGPHPNKAHAAWGDAPTGWNPTRSPRRSCGGCSRSGGPGTAWPASPGALNDAGIPCPSAAGPGRNPHRAGDRWMLGTVRAILANPRYTGRQVWNRQPASHELVDPASTGLGHRQIQRWNLPGGWVISARPARPALVSEEDFTAVQGIRAGRGTGTTAGWRRYLLAGLLRCGICGRRLESCWASNRPAYRCRHGHSSATTPNPGRPKNTYTREDHILPHLPALNSLLAATAPASGPRRRRTRRGVEVPRPVTAKDAIGYLRARQITLT